MKFRFKLLTIIICSLLCLTCFSISAKTNEIDITTSSVRDDLASMDMDRLSYLSDTENIFITMSQYYDNDNNLRSYLYINYINDFTDVLYVNLSVSTINENYELIEEILPYQLVFINNEETWCKYEILDLPNIEYTTRRYYIDSIDIYHGTSQGTSIAPVISNICQTFIYNGISNDTLKVFHEEIETITITEKEVSFYCYGEENKWSSLWGLDEHLGWGKTYTDSWFIFFNTDKQIDELLEVEITFTKYDYVSQKLGTIPMNTCFTEAVLQSEINSEYNGSLGVKTSMSYYDPEITTVVPDKVQISASDNWWGGYKTTYEYVDAIIDLREYNHSDDSGNPFVFSSQAEKYTWGVNFLNTEKTCTLQSVNIAGQSGSSSVINGSGVCDTAILRLKFMTNGVIKNCYAVDIPTDDFTGNTALVEIEGLLEKITMLLGLVFLVVLLCMFPPLLNVFKYLFKVIVYVLSLPIKFIKWLLKDEKKTKK